MSNDGGWPRTKTRTLVKLRMMRMTRREERCRPMGSTSGVSRVVRERYCGLRWRCLCRDLGVNSFFDKFKIYLSKVTKATMN